MMTKTLDGLMAPIDHLLIPPGYLYKLPATYRNAFTLTLMALGANYIEMRRQEANIPGTVKESGASFMRRTLPHFTEAHDDRKGAPLVVQMFEPLMPIPDLAFQLMDGYLVDQGLMFKPDHRLPHARITTLANLNDDPLLKIVPQIIYNPDQSIEIQWREH